MMHRKALCGQIVAMMQAAEPWSGNDLCTLRGAGRRLTAYRSLLFQPGMRPVIVVIADVLSHEPLATAFIEHNHMVE